MSCLCNADSDSVVDHIVSYVSVINVLTDMPVANLCRNFQAIS